MAKAKPVTIIDDDAQEDQLIDSPHEVGEQSAQGSASDPSTDDDVEELAGTMGLYGDKKGTNQDMTPVGIGEQVDQAEKNRRGIDENTFSDE
jgi:hypothetical protein